MHYFSKSGDMSFEDAVAATTEALKRHHFVILAEIDLRKAFSRYLAVDFRPYLILSACSPQLAHRAIQADNEIGSVLPCNVVVQQHRSGRVEISAADPAAMIGTINHVDLIWISRELRTLVQQVIDEVESWPKSGNALRKEDRELAHAA